MSFSKKRQMSPSQRVLEVQPNGSHSTLSRIFENYDDQIPLKEKNRGVHRT